MDEECVEFLLDGTCARRSDCDCWCHKEKEASNG